MVMVRRMGKYMWTSEKSLEDMVAPLFRKTVMKVSDTFLLTPHELEDLANGPYKSKVHESDTSKSEVQHLRAYATKLPHKALWDLSQNPEWGPNTELRNGSLPNFTTNYGSLYSTELKRTMTPWELLLNQGVPVTEAAAKAAGVRQLKFEVPPHAVVRMAGNGMHVPCMGAALLAAMLHTNTRTA